LLARLAESGVGILFYTTDINELVNLSHRVYVMADGEVSAELRAPDITEENVLRAAFASSTATAEGAPAAGRVLQPEGL
jgi:ribose transport system ATP-binding protein